jgi:uncharacterized protein YbcV (DUF1398 family)
VVNTTKKQQLSDEYKPIALGFHFLSNTIYMTFTIEQIKAAHSKVKSGADFPRYIRDLIQLGVTGYATYVADGHTVYSGEGDFHISSEPKYAALNIAEHSDKEQFIKDLRNHQQGNTDYPTFCSDCAASGVEKWEVHMGRMICAYYDREGNELLIEHIPSP